MRVRRLLVLALLTGLGAVIAFSLGAAIAFFVEGMTASRAPHEARTEAWQLVTARLEGDAALDRRIAALQDRLTEGGPDADSLERIGWLFVDKARESGDAGFFHLARAAAEAMDDARGSGASADLLRGHALHGLHRFDEAEAVARRLVQARGLAFDHGLLGDVLVDRGRIEEGTRAYQRMMDLAPGSAALIRAGHVRFLTGDIEGAVEALHFAARAVSPRRPERFAWTWAQLSRYLLHAGARQAAHASAARAAAVAPDSVPARLAEAGALLAEDRFEEAIPPLRRATRGQASPQVLWTLAEALRATGREDEALATEERLLARGAEIDPRGLSLWLAHTRRDVPRALALARRELEARQDPYTLDALAWAEHAAGDARAAWAHLALALASGTPEPRFHLHAAAIARAMGDARTARLHQSRAARLRHLLLPSERDALAALGGPEVSGG